MPSLRKSILTTTKASLKVSPALIKKMELFSSSYQNLQNKHLKPNIPNNITYQTTASLDSFLLEQISEQYISDIDALILSRMVELLDDNGLFTNWPYTTKIIQKEFEISRRKTYDLLHVFQELEPEGVGATSVLNFLEIQIKNHELEDEEFKANILRILTFEKELIAQDFKLISNKTGISLENISLSLLFIKNNLVYTLPRQQFPTNNTQHILPSAKVFINKNAFEIEMLEDFSNVSNHELLQILKERSESIRNILVLFFQKQRPSNFQKSGLLKPITQKSIAEIAGLNYSTVSRLVNSKYLFLENKLYLFKSLFQRKVNNSNYSSLFIKKHIATNLNKTDKVLSKEFEKLGIHISRRTVNYYRNKFF